MRSTPAPGHGTRPKRGATRAREGGDSLIVRRTVAEKVILGAVQEKLATPENISYVFKRVEQKVREMGSEVPATIRLKEAELDAEERRVANFVEFIAEGRGSKALAGALTLSERKSESLKADLEALRQSRDDRVDGPLQDDLGLEKGADARRARPEE